METLESKTRKARKEHRCDLCGGVINVGEEYNYQATCECGEFWHSKTHKECDEYIFSREDIKGCVDGVGEVEFQEFLQDDCLKHGIEYDWKNQLELVKKILELEKGRKRNEL